MGNLLDRKGLKLRYNYCAQRNILLERNKVWILKTGIREFSHSLFPSLEKLKAQENATMVLSKASADDNKSY